MKRILIMILLVSYVLAGCNKQSSNPETVEQKDVVESERKEEIKPQVKEEKIQKKNDDKELKEKKDLSSLTIDISSKHSEGPKQEKKETVKVKQKATKKVKKKKEKKKKKESVVPKAGEQGDMKDNNNYAFVDEQSGDIDMELKGKTSDIIFLDYVSLITADFPLNRVDYILTEVSRPIIKEYGKGDYIYGMTDYTLHSKENVTFKIKGRDNRVFQVSIKRVKNKFDIKVKESKK